MTFLQTALAFIVAISVLVAFHELGHYTVARLCGVKVLRFSLGIGKIIWSRRFGKDQTEWAVSALPLGGYVKLLDARTADMQTYSEADRQREFTSQPVWKRIAIVAAGPFANFLLAVVVLTGLYLVGIPEPVAKLRAVPERSAAFAAGLKGGETVVAVGGEPVQNWQQFRWLLADAVIDGRPSVLLAYRPGQGEDVRTAVLPLPKHVSGREDGQFAEALGFSLAVPPAVIQSVENGSPAEKAGLKGGDNIIGMDGKPVLDALALILAVRERPGVPISLQVANGDTVRTVVLTPDAVTDQKKAVGRLGVRVSLLPEMTVMRLGMVNAWTEGLKKTWETTRMSVKMIGKIATGALSVKNISGPIAIAGFAGQSARAGLARYLYFIVFISISLGVMNLLPIPVLDGGLLLYYAVELVIGRPVPDKLAEIGYKIGMGFLGVLFLAAIFNDIVRLFPE